jgi:Rrf2 family protein
MKLSTKGRYGTRFMIRLALAGPDAVCTLKEIAKEEDISEKYLWQIARGLKDAGYIHAAPGAHGGYRLARAPSTLTMADILTALEGDLALVDCANTETTCRRGSDCVARGVWQEVTVKIREILDGIRLDELVERHRRLRGDRIGEYSI